MKLLEPVVLFLLLLLALTEPGNAKLIIAPSSRHCTLLDATLECTYEGVQEAVILERLGGEVGKQIKKLVIHNTKELEVSGTACVKLHLSNVAKATFIRPHTCHAVDDLSLKLVESNINLVPKYVVRLEMESSSVREFVTEKELQSLTIVNSKIGTLNIIHPIDDNVIVRIDHSSIETLEKLRLENRAQLLMVNTTINHLKKNAIQLDEASANIWVSHIKLTEEEGVIIGEKSTITLNDVSGKITLSGPQDNLDGLHPPGIPSQRPAGMRLRSSRSTTTSPALWLIPSFLALIEAMIIMVNCTNWFPAFKSGRRKRAVEDGAKLLSPPSSVSHQSTAYYGQDNQSSVYYSSEAFDQSSLNKRQKSGKNF